MNIELPWPPSVNTYWRSIPGKGRPRVIISEKGRLYRSAVMAATLRRSLLARVFRSEPRSFGPDTKIALEIVAYPPDRRRRDLDNLLKAPLDALTHAAVWADDSQIRRIVIEFGEVRKGGALAINLKEMAE